MIDTQASHDVPAPACAPPAGAQAPKRAAIAGVRAASSGASDETSFALGMAAKRSRLPQDALGRILARAVARRAQQTGDAHADARGLLQRTPKAWTREAAPNAIAALTPGRASASFWPPIQLLVARYGQFAPYDVKQREDTLGDIEHVMARWRNNQRSAWFRTDLETRKFAALDDLAVLIAKERAEIVVATTRDAKAAAEPRPLAPATAAPHAPRPVKATPAAPMMPDFRIGGFLQPPSRNWDDPELFEEGVRVKAAQDAMDAHAEARYEVQERLIEAYVLGDAKMLEGVEAMIKDHDLEGHHRLPSRLEFAAALDHPLPCADPPGPEPRDLREGPSLGRPHRDAPMPIPGFSDAESVSVDRYFGRKIRAAATGPETARRELDAELTDAGLEHRYHSDASRESGDPERLLTKHLGLVASGRVVGVAPGLIPGLAPTDSARIDGQFRRRIREAARSGDERGKAAIDAELIERGLEFRYIRAFGSVEHGQDPATARDLEWLAGAPLTNPAGGDQRPPDWGLGEPGAVSDRTDVITGLSPQESVKLDGYFARVIRTATRTHDPKTRARLMSEIDADLIRRGLENRYYRAAGTELTPPLIYPDEPAAPQFRGAVRRYFQPELIPGLSPKETAETDVYFRREIRKAVNSGKPLLVKHVAAQLTAIGLDDRYQWDTPRRPDRELPLLT